MTSRISVDRKLFLFFTFFFNLRHSPSHTFFSFLSLEALRNPQTITNHSMFKLLAVVAVSALLLQAASATDPVYERPFVGGFVNTKNGAPPTGYVIMSLDDISSPAFVEYYNNRGVDFIQTFPDGPLCCEILTSTGFLAYGQPGNLSYLEPFQGSTDVCTSGTMPQKTIFGGGPISGEPLYYKPIPILNTTSIALLSTTAQTPEMSCQNAAGMYTAYFKLIPGPSGQFEYKLQQVGPDYPVPSGGWEQATFADVKSADFSSFYNKNGLKITQAETANYCCMIQVAGNGWIMYGAAPGRSPISTFEPSTGAWNCSAVNTVLNLYTTFGGNYQNAFFPQWNSTITSQLSLLYNDTNDYDGCIGLPDTLALLKKSVSPNPKQNYKVQQVGPHYPAPTGWQMASLADLKGDDFASFYNKNGIQLGQGESANYCCMIQVSDGGWVMYGATPGRSPLTTFSTNGGWECAVPNVKLYLATYFGGNYQNALFPQWNSTITSQLSLLMNNTNDFDGCQTLPDTLALWKQPA